MNLIKKLKHYFNNGELPKEDKDKPIEYSVQTLEQTPEGKRWVEKSCAICNKEIGIDHYTKKLGKFYHKKCWKQAIKSANVGYNG